MDDDDKEIVMLAEQMMPWFKDITATERVPYLMLQDMLPRAIADARSGETARLSQAKTFFEFIERLLSIRSPRVTEMLELQVFETLQEPYLLDVDVRPMLGDKSLILYDAWKEAIQKSQQRRGQAPS